MTLIPDKVINQNHFPMGSTGPLLVRLQRTLMSNVCQVTGRAPSFGNAVSHSNRHTRRRWTPNIQTKRYWVPSERRLIRLRVSTRGMKVIDKRGIDSVVAEIRRRGEELR